jgi:hypothetical protein
MRLKKLPLLPLQYFRNLCTLSMFYDGDIPRTYCLGEITVAINASPGLTNLRIMLNCRQRVKECTSLQSFLQAAKPELVQLELRSVPLSSTGIREILSHKLQQLSVSTLPGARHIEFDWRRLWTALQETGNELQLTHPQGFRNQGWRMRWMRCLLTCSPTLNYGS